MEVDLDPTTYGNETVYFAIHHKGDDQYFFQIDNILLKDCNSSSVNISEKAPTAKLSVFPNPFTDQTSVFFASDQSSGFQIDIFDITGKHIISRQEKTNSKVLINRDGLNAGIYILKANDSYHSFNKKLIVK